jgi:hypothetical protein
VLRIFRNAKVTCRNSDLQILSSVADPGDLTPYLTYVPVPRIQISYT